MGKERDEKLVATPFHETDDFKRMSTVNALVDIMSESFVAQSEENDDYEKSYCKELEYILQFDTEEDFAMVAALTAARRILTRFTNAQKKRIITATRITHAEQDFFDSLAPNPRAPRTPKTACEKFLRDELLRQRFKSLDSLLRKEAGDLKNFLRLLFTHFYGFISAIKKVPTDVARNQPLLETFPKTYLKLNRRLYNKIYSTTTNNKRVPCVFDVLNGDRDLSTEGTSLDKACESETAPRKRANNESSINLRNHAKKPRDNHSSTTMADPLGEIF